MKASNLLKALTFISFFGVTATVSCSSEKDQQTQNTPLSTQQQQVTQQQVNPVNSTTSVKKPEKRISATEVMEKILCPEAAELSKKGLFWGAPDGWRSYSQSFVDEIVSFVEAQWHGVNVGKMMCVYVGKRKRSFPVVLQNDLLTKMPSGYSWGDYKNGIAKCKSTNINDCPFFYTKRDVDIEKAYKELDFKKGGDDSLD